MFYVEYTRLGQSLYSNHGSGLWPMSKREMPHPLETSAIPSHISFISLRLVASLIPKCETVFSNHFVTKSVTNVPTIETPKKRICPFG